MDLSKLDPNVAALLIGAGVSLVTWLYHKARGQKSDTLADVISGIVDNAIHTAVVEADSDPSGTVALVENGLWFSLLKAKVPRNATTEMLVHAAVQQGVAAAIDQAKQRAHEVELAVAKNNATIDAVIASGALKKLSDTADAALAESRKPFGGGAPNVTIIGSKRTADTISVTVTDGSAPDPAP